VLIEPPNYPNKAIEPYVRSNADQIPLRFSELEQILAKNQTRIMIAKEPIVSFSSFTILKPTGINFALVFYRLPDLFDTLAIFFEKTYNKEAAVPMADAKRAAKRTVEIVKATMSFQSEYRDE
jgi:hypothetical protein